jgi:uncharacterized protein YbcI
MREGDDVADTSSLTGEELNAAVTDALERIHAEHLERRPQRTSTFHHDNVVVSLMHEVLSNAEKILVQNNRQRDVGELRELFLEHMESDFREAVERLTGRKVVALLTSSRLDADLAAALFVLDAPL